MREEQALRPERGLQSASMSLRPGGDARPSRSKAHAREGMHNPLEGWTLKRTEVRAPAAKAARPKERDLQVASMPQRGGGRVRGERAEGAQPGMTRQDNTQKSVVCWIWTLNVLRKRCADWARWAISPLTPALTR